MITKVVTLFEYYWLHMLHNLHRCTVYTLKSNSKRWIHLANVGPMTGSNQFAYLLLWSQLNAFNFPPFPGKICVPWNTVFVFVSENKIQCDVYVYPATGHEVRLCVCVLQPLYAISDNDWSQINAVWIWNLQQTHNMHLLIFQLQQTSQYVLWLPAALLAHVANFNSSSSSSNELHQHTYIYIAAAITAAVNCSNSNNKL